MTLYRHAVPRRKYELNGLFRLKLTRPRSSPKKRCNGRNNRIIDGLGAVSPRAPAKYQSKFIIPGMEKVNVKI